MCSFKFYIFISLSLSLLRNLTGSYHFSNKMSISIEIQNLYFVETNSTHNFYALLS